MKRTPVPQAVAALVSSTEVLLTENEACKACGLSRPRMVAYREQLGAMRTPQGWRYPQAKVLEAAPTLRKRRGGMAPSVSGVVESAILHELRAGVPPLDVAIKLHVPSALVLDAVEAMRKLLVLPAHRMGARYRCGERVTDRVSAGGAVITELTLEKWLDGEWQEMIPWRLDDGSMQLLPEGLSGPPGSFCETMIEHDVIRKYVGALPGDKVPEPPKVVAPSSAPNPFAAVEDMLKGKKK